MSIKIKFFEMTAPFYEKIHFSGKEKIVQLTEKENFFQKSDRVLDLAGGTGRIAQLFVEQVKEIVVVDELSFSEAKTRMMADTLKKLVGEDSVLILCPEKNEVYEAIIRSTNNLPGAKTILASYLNVRDLLGYDKVILPVQALKVISGNLG